MMSHVDQVNCVDRSLRDILKVNKPFGGIPVVFGGDPRQILPVVRHGSNSQTVKMCIYSSPLSDDILQIKHKTNMRVAMDEVAFSTYLLTVGNGTAQIHTDIGPDMIQIPQEYLVDTLNALINKVFPNIEEGYSHKYYVSCCAILTPRNTNVDIINEIIMHKYPGKGKTYFSSDTIAEDDLSGSYPTEFLNSVTASGIPPHAMTLKIVAPVMLLRNLRAGPGNGLRNGT